MKTKFDKLIKQLMEKKCGKKKVAARVNPDGMMGSASVPHKVKTKVIPRKQKHKNKDIE
tara:strand:- start:493 stop:669 length:177 start_codon:yes stop_codon:yes gene_type:complete